jgi:hypothetical protein
VLALQATVVEYAGSRSDAGQFHGHGSALFSSGQQYEGEWQQGHMHGSGRLTFPDGVCYHGSFVADSISGKGVSDAVLHHSEYMPLRACYLL